MCTESGKEVRQKPS